MKMNFVTKEPINKGWSSDRKYCVTAEDGTRYCLRISDLAQLDRRQREFNGMKQAASLGIPMCQPIEFGVCEEGVYSLQSWIDGEDAEQVILQYSDAQQYQYGRESCYGSFIRFRRPPSRRIGKSAFVERLIVESRHIGNVRFSMRAEKR